MFTSRDESIDQICIFFGKIKDLEGMHPSLGLHWRMIVLINNYIISSTNVIWYGLIYRGKVDQMNEMNIYRLNAYAKYFSSTHN